MIDAPAKPGRPRPLVSTAGAFIIMLPLLVIMWWGGFLAYSYYIVDGHATSDVSLKLSPLDGIEWKMKAQPYFAQPQPDRK
jgi:hypothetical protein